MQSYKKKIRKKNENETLKLELKLWNCEGMEMSGWMNNVDGISKEDKYTLHLELLSAKTLDCKSFHWPNCQSHVWTIVKNTHQNEYGIILN